MNPSDPERKPRPCIVFIETGGQLGLIAGTSTCSEDRGHTFTLQAGTDDWLISQVTDTTYFYPEYRNTVFSVPVSDVKKVLGSVRAKHMLGLRRYAEAKVAAVINEALKTMPNSPSEKE